MTIKSTVKYAIRRIQFHKLLRSIIVKLVRNMLQAKQINFLHNAEHK